MGAGAGSQIAKEVLDLVNVSGDISEVGTFLVQFKSGHALNTGSLVMKLRLY